MAGDMHSRKIDFIRLFLCAGEIMTDIENVDGTEEKKSKKEGKENGKEVKNSKEDHEDNDRNEKVSLQSKVFRNVLNTAELFP